MLQTAQANISPIDGQRSVNVRLILDNGSNRSYITEKARAYLGLPSIAKENLNISVFGQTQSAPRSCDIVQVNVKNKEGGQPVCISATVVPYICKNLHPHNEASWYKNNYNCFKDIKLADPKIEGNMHSSVDILVGSDFYWAFVENEIIRSSNGPVALKTKLGWVLSGPVEAPCTSDSTLFVNSFDQEMDKIKSFWQTENLGICDSEPTFLDKFDSKIEFNGGRYSVPLPFKECQNVISSDNKKLAKTRFQSQIIRLTKQPDLFKAYHFFFNRS